MVRWEYLTETIPQDKWTERCNELGADGWELVGLHQDKRKVKIMEWEHTGIPIMGDEVVCVCYFKRRAQDEQG